MCSSAPYLVNRPAPHAQISPRLSTRCTPAPGQRSHHLSRLQPRTRVWWLDYMCAGGGNERGGRERVFAVIDANAEGRRSEAKERKRESEMAES